MINKKIELKVLIGTLGLFLFITTLHQLYFKFIETRSEKLNVDLTELESEIKEFNKKDSIRKALFLRVDIDKQNEFSNDYKKFWLYLSKNEEPPFSNINKLGFIWLTLNRNNFKIDHIKKKVSFDYKIDTFDLREESDFFNLVKENKYFLSDERFFEEYEEIKSKIVYYERLRESDWYSVTFFYILFAVIFGVSFILRYMIYLIIFTVKAVMKFNFKAFFKRTKYYFAVFAIILFITKPNSKDFEEMGYYNVEKKFDALIFNCYDTGDGIYIGILGNAIYWDD